MFLPIEVGDKYLTIVPEGNRWAIERLDTRTIISRHSDYEEAMQRIAEMQKTEPNASDRRYRQGGTPTTGPERYS